MNQPDTRDRYTLDEGVVHEVKRLRFKTRRMITAVMSGGFQSAFRGAGLTFRELRPYQPGDDVRSIQWNTFARTGSVFVRTYDEERHLRFHLLIDASGSIGARIPTVAQRLVVEFSALITLLAQQQGDALGLSYFTDTILSHLPAKQSRFHTDRVLRAVLRPPPPAGRTDLAAALAAFQQLERYRSVVFLISDFFSPEFGHALRRLAAQHDVVAVLLNPPHEPLPSVGLIQVVDPETGMMRLVDTSHRHGRALLEAHAATRAREIESLCHTAGVDLAPLTANPLTTLRNLILKRRSGLHG